MSSDVLVVGLVAAAAWLLTGPGRRLRVAAPEARARRWRPGRNRMRVSRSARGGEPPLGGLLVEVGARMRTGADARSAWRDSLRDEPGAPSDLDQLATRARSTSRRDAIAGARAAVGVAERLGAPVADVLECCAEGLSEAEEAASQRRTALAAPSATARLLTWLPVAGLGLGVLLGVDPIAVFTDGSAGTACFALGAVFTLAGRRWSRVLVRQAEKAGQ